MNRHSDLEITIMKKTLFVAAISAFAVLLMGACNKHSWESTKRLYDEDHGHKHSEGEKKEHAEPSSEGEAK